MSMENIITDRSRLLSSDDRDARREKLHAGLQSLKAALAERGDHE